MVSLPGTVARVGLAETRVSSRTRVSLFAGSPVPAFAPAQRSQPGHYGTAAIALRIGARRCPLGLEFTLDFDSLIALDVIANLDVIVVLHTDTTLGAGTNVADVILEPAQRF